MGIVATGIIGLVGIVIVIVILWVLFWWLYQRATKEVAFVRTGLGGQKVVQNGGAFVVPVLHDTIRVSMGTTRLEISRRDGQSAITRDRMRVDVTAEFYVRVGGNPDDIALAAQSLGSKTGRPEAMRDLLEGRFVDALRTVAAEMTMEELHEQRGEYIRRVKELVKPEIAQTGLELESASLTALDQTNRQFFNPDNAFDAEGLTRLTADIEERRLKRNAIEQDSEISIQKKKLETETRRLELGREEEYARLAQQQEIAIRRAEQAALILAEEEAKRQQSAEARVAAELNIAVASTRAEEAREIARLTARKEIERQNQTTRQEMEGAAIETELALKLRRIEHERQVAVIQAQSAAETALVEADKMREREEARVEADLRVRVARVKADQRTRLEELSFQTTVEGETQKKRRSVEEAVIETDGQIRLARIAQEKAIAVRQATEQAEISQFEAARKLEADEAAIRAAAETDRHRLEAERLIEIERVRLAESVEVARSQKQQAVSKADMDAKYAIDLLQIEQRQTLTEVEHQKDIAVAESTKKQIAALVDVEAARLALVRAEQQLDLVRAQEREEREKVIALIRARTDAERATVAMIVSAEGRALEAQHRARAAETDTRSEAGRIQALAEAEALAERARLEADRLRQSADADAVRAMVEAENTMSQELMTLKLRLSVIENLKDILHESVKPMEKIGDIRILQVDGLMADRGGRNGAGVEGPSGPANLPDQVVDSALRYRTQAPVVDTLLREIGLASPDSGGVSGFLRKTLAGDAPGDDKAS